MRSPVGGDAPHPPTEQARPYTPHSTGGDRRCKGDVLVFAAEFGTGQVFLSMLWFFLFVTWFWLLITVCSDLFRSQDLSGWGKAAWAVFVIFMPYLGVFAYL